MGHWILELGCWELFRTCSQRCDEVIAVVSSLRDSSAMRRCSGVKPSLPTCQGQGREHYLEPFYNT